MNLVWPSINRTGIERNDALYVDDMYAFFYFYAPYVDEDKSKKGLNKDDEKKNPLTKQNTNVPSFLYLCT
jgi:hypothetical protein